MSRNRDEYLTLKQNYATNYVLLEDSLNMPTNQHRQSNMPTRFPQSANQSPMNDDAAQRVIIHHVEDVSKETFNHINDLDEFFQLNYTYHQKGGMLAIIFENLGASMITYPFTVIFTLFIYAGVNYPCFSETTLNKVGGNDSTTFIETNKAMNDCFFSFADFRQNMSWSVTFLTVLASIFGLCWLVYSVTSIQKFRKIKRFYNHALDIPDNKIADFTWEEVQNKILKVQDEHQMCVHKQGLTSLDIYQRILRFDNYIISLINRNYLPFRFKIPFYGDYIFLTKSLKTAVEFMLFFAVFKNNWHLKDEFKVQEKRMELALGLKSKITFVAIISVIFMPLVFLYQVLYAFYNYADVLKREPSFFSTRRWSHYAEIYFRHYNELNHELQARLSRAYRPAKTYINSFPLNPVMVQILLPFTYISAAIAGYLITLIFYNADAIEIKGLLLMGSVTTGLSFVFRSLIPEENVPLYPELMIERVLSEVHYMPENFIGRAHTSAVRTEFTRLFQYRITHLIEEILSPIVIPVYFYFVLKPKSLDIVDFFRNFTVEVAAVGDICSFAMMDVKKHGNPTWHPDVSNVYEKIPEYSNPSHRAKTDYGRTERSLLHFTLTNPRWQPPEEAAEYLDALKKYGTKESVQGPMGAMGATLEANECSSVDGAGAFSSSRHMGDMGHSPIRHMGHSPPRHMGNANPYSQNANLFSSMYNTDSIDSVHNMQSMSMVFPDPVLAPNSMSASTFNQDPVIFDGYHPQDLVAREMRTSMLYLNNIHNVNRFRSIARDANAEDVDAGRQQTASTSNLAYQQYDAGVATDLQPTTSTSYSAAATSVSFRKNNEDTPLLGD